jgi:hypothetical protein
LAKLVKSAELPGKARAIGIGAHRCAGPNLAQMEMEAALKTCFERIPEFELTDPDAVTWAAGQVRGARNVPVRF